MNNSLLKLSEQVVVITGASSGIGRATALAFARHGCHVVLGARRERPLQKLAAECARHGVRAEAVVVDVTDADAVEKLAARAYAGFGGIDVWVNNAGVGVFGPFAAADMKTHRRVIETNLFGTMHGAAAVLPYFLRQNRGILINNISMGGWVPVPFASSYTASKFGIRGFVASLRQELAHAPNIRVCSVFPSFIDTPGFQHSGNISGMELRPARPLYSPEAVAKTMVSLVLRPRDEVAVGWPALAAKLCYGVAPALTERAAGAVVRRYLRSARPARKTTGHLFRPVSAGTGASGGWRHPSSISITRAAGIAAAALIAVGATLVFGGGRRAEASQALA